MKIYCIKIKDISKEKLNMLCLLVDLEKRYKISKFIYIEDKIRTLVAEILIRTIVIEQLNIRNKYITFCKNQFGKPYLKNFQKFNFNISHSGDFIVCAIDDEPLGIDIEEVKYIEYEVIAKSFFTTSEVDYILKNDFEIRLSKFYEIWTLKESYIKYCGQGLTIPLKSFSIDIDKFENVKLIANNKRNEYIFRRFDMKLDYKITVCSLNKDIPNDMIMIDQNNLINKFLKLCIG